MHSSNDSSLDPPPSHENSSTMADDGPSQSQSHGSPSTIEVEDLRNLTEDQKRTYGWKYLGYPELAKFMASSDDFLVLRRFSRLGTRATLFLQDQITVLEAEIERLDTLSMVRPGGQVNSFRVDQECFEDRHQCMKKLSVLLKKYYDFLESFSAFQSRPEAETVQIENVRNWHDSAPFAIDLPERQYIKRDGDLITLVNTSRSYFYQLLEMLSLVRWLFKHRQPREDRPESDSTTYWSGRWLGFATSILIVALGLGMLLGPLWLFEIGQGNQDSLKIITSFVVVFAVIVLGSTTSDGATRGLEVLGGTAAYAALLTLFLRMSGST